MISTNYDRISFENLDGSKVYLDFHMASFNAESKYILRSIDGLGPPESNLHFKQDAVEGGVFSGFRPVERQLVLLVGLNPRYAILENAGTIRRELYAMLPTNGVIQAVLQHVNGNNRISTRGMVKRIESVPFSKDPLVQITVDCESAYFYGAPRTTTALSATNTITNPGDAEVGFHVTEIKTPSSPPASFSLITNATTPYGKQMTLQNAIIPANSSFEIDTRPGSRKIKMATGYNLLRFRSMGSSWPTLIPGTNSIFLSFPFTGTYKITYTPMYWGV